MAWFELYIPPSSSNWQGRADAPAASCFWQKIQLADLQQPLPDFDKPAIALLGFCCDEGVRRNFGREGAAQGPDTLREVLAKIPFHREGVTVLDAGDIFCKTNDLESAQIALAEAVHLLLSKHIVPVIIGGGHEVAWGNYQGIIRQYPDIPLGIINFDAHFDMRPVSAEGKGSSGTPFLQIAQACEQANRPFNYYCLGIQHTGNIPALFQTAEKYHTHHVFAEAIQFDEHKDQELMEQVLAKHEKIYLTVCLDVFAAAYAPGVSAPQVLGLTPWQVLPSVRRLAESGKVVSYDIAELSPPFDLDLRTSKLAANLVYEIIHHHLFENMNP